MGSRPDGRTGHRQAPFEVHSDRKEAVQMTGFRRVIAWFLITLVVVSLVATLVVGEAS
jgi:hypothetical protein